MRDYAALDQWERRAEWPLAAIAVLFLVVYSIEVLFQPQASAFVEVDLVAKIAWATFVIDYVIRLWLAPDRRHWFFHHLADLAVVLLPLLRPLHFLRVIIMITALQKAVGNAIRGRVALYASSTAILLTYVASLAVLNAERSHPDATITTFGRAIWWAITTVTTVGYGDQFPVTTTGRVIAALLMIGGISLLGTITATIASWIVQRVSEEENLSQAITTAQIAELRDEIVALRRQLQQNPD